MKMVVMHAKKIHRCASCGNYIFSGDLFTMRQYKEGGSNTNHPTCLDCDGREWVKRKVRTFKVGCHYIFVEPYYREVWPLKYQARIGDVVSYQGKSLGYGLFYKTDDSGEQILLEYDDAFRYLELNEKEKERSK